MGEATRLGLDAASFRISSRAGQVAQRAFGETIIVYQRAENLVLYTGSGRLFGLEHEAPGFNRLKLDLSLIHI